MMVTSINIDLFFHLQRLQGVYNIVYSYNIYIYNHSNLYVSSPAFEMRVVKNKVEIRCVPSRCPYIQHLLLLLPCCRRPYVFWAAQNIIYVPAVSVPSPLPLYIYSDTEK